MGNNHAHEVVKVPDKLDEPLSGKCGRGTRCSKPKIFCNTPYLTALFGKMAELSREQDSALTENLVSQKVFQDAFNGPLRVLGKLLFTHIQGTNTASHTIHLDEFLSVSSDVLSLVNTNQILNYYFDVFSERKDFMTIDDVFHTVQVCLSVALTAAYLPFDQSEDHSKLLRSLSASLMGAAEKLARQEFLTWTSKHIPHIFNGVHSFIRIKLSTSTLHDEDWHKRMSQGPKSIGQADLSLDAVTLLTVLDNKLSTLTHSTLWILSSCLPARYLTGPRASGSSIVPNFLMSRLQQLTEQNAWTQLYNSDHDGLSINRFEHHVFQYKGSTLTLITFEGNLYALATDEEWRESSQMWGKSDTVLVQLVPRFGIVDSGRILFLNHHARGSFKGIQVGSDTKHPILKIEDMATVKHNGLNLPLHHVEVWGCSGSHIRAQQLRQRAWEHKEVEKIRNRKLKLESWEDNPDRMLLNWAGVSTNHATKV